MVHEAVAAAEAVASEGISVEVIDLRTVAPLDIEPILESVTKTSRLLIAHEAVESGGVGAEVAARLGSAAFDELDGPILRVGCPFAPIPFAPELERALLPGAAQIERAGRLSPQQLRDIHITGPAGELLPLSAIATVRDGVEPRTLNRFQQLNAIKLSGVAPRSLDQGLRVLEARRPRA